MKKLLNSIEYKTLEYFSLFLMIFWSISPIIEYIFKYYIKAHYMSYFRFIIYFIGILGIIEYIIYISKQIIDKSFNIKKCIPQILIEILLIQSIISSICSNDSYLSFFGDTYRKEGLIVYVMYIGFILSSSIITNKKYIKKIFKIILISALFITIMPYFQSNFTYYNFLNIYHNTNHYGYFLMISTMLAGFMFISIAKIKRIIYLLIYIFLTYILILNNTFGCYLAIFITIIFSIIYSLIKKYKRIDTIILLTTFILVSFLVSRYNIRLGEKIHYGNNNKIVINNIISFSNDVKKTIKSNNQEELNNIGSRRGLLWKEAWNYTKEHPLIGGGMECLNKYYKSKKVTHNDRPHNVILQFSSFIGIPGAIVYIILILYLAINNLKNISKSPINFTIYTTSMCYFISSLFGNSMYYTSPYFMILLGLLISMNTQKEIKK